jgi:hypothetical protein
MSASEGETSVFNPLICEKCGQELESDDAISIIEGRCAACRQTTEALCQPFRADQMIARAAAKEGRIVGGDPAPYQASPIRPKPQEASPRVAEPIIAADDPADGSDDPSYWPSRPQPGTRAEPRLIPPILPRPSSPSIPSSRSVKCVRAGEGLHPPIPPFDARPTVTFRRRRRDLGAGIAVGLILTIAISGYLIRGQSEVEQFAVTQNPTGIRLALRVSPSFATVKLDGTDCGPADRHGRLIVSVDAGALTDRWLEVSAPGHQSIRQPLAMYRGAPEAFIELMREPYDLILATNPPEAEVWVNGERKGTSPANLRVASSGEANLEIRHEGYVTLSKVIRPPANGNSLELRLDLVRQGPVLCVETDPEQTAVTIDGKPVGTTPLKLQLDAAYLGKTVDIVAAAKGFDEAGLTMTLPTNGEADPVPARLILVLSRPRVEVRTDPPGGRIIVAGQDYGRAPAMVAFDASQTGRTVAMEGSLQDSYFGRRVLTVPPPGRPVSFTIPLIAGAQRTVFLMGWPAVDGVDEGSAALRSKWAERRDLADRLTSLIHQLTPSHRFCILAATEGGMAAWPDDRKMEAGSNEQKVRAYDVVRAVRPAGPIDLDDMLQASLAYKPTTIWVVMAGELDLVALERFGNRPESGDISLNAVRSSADEDAAWLETWTARHNGILTTLDREVPAALAMDEHTD